MTTIVIAMSFLRHQNIHILEKALVWRKNGLLSAVTGLFDPHFLLDKRAPVLISIRNTTGAR